MRRILWVVAAVLAIMTPAGVSAQDVGREERLALAERAINAAQAEQLMAMTHQMTQALNGPDLEGMSAQERAAFHQVMDQLVAEMSQRMIAGMAEIYADIFTVEELVAFAEFYESPIGQSILEKNAAAAPRFLELVQAMMPDMMRMMVNGMCDRLGCTGEERNQLTREALSGLGMSES